MFFKKSKTQTPKNIQATLQAYTINGVAIYPWISHIAHEGNVLTIDIRLPKAFDPEQIHAELGQLLHPKIQEINMNVTVIDNPPNQTTPIQQHTMQNKPTAQDILPPHPRIRHIIAIASGKGGVGKSTTTVNIALALHQLGLKVGILDADIYGPSIPDMMGVADKRPTVEAGEFVPIDAHGLPIISIGSLLDSEETPIAWRGIKATGALMQLYNQTAFPHLDYLLIDMPPGTGDIALTLAQRIPITGAIIVTTPQHIALLDVKKGMELFTKTHIPIIGIVENMALHTCQNCGHTEAIFGCDGGEAIARQYQVPLLGRLPLARSIGEQVDKGVPSMLANDSKGDDNAIYYLNIAKAIESNITKFAKAHDEQRIF